MKVIINTSNLKIGGALQVALSFMEELKVFGCDEYHVFLSKKVREQLQVDSFPRNFIFYSFNRSISSIRYRFSLVKRLKKLEQSIDPAVVFSVFGPSYWRPESPHVVGIADGWCYNYDSIAWQVLPLIERLKNFLLVKYKNYYFKRDVDFYIGETEDVCNRVARYLDIDREKVQVVSNTCGAIYTYSKRVGKAFNGVGSFKMLVLSANYSHKNLCFIPRLSKHMRFLGINVKFYLTLNDSEFKSLVFEDDDMIVNLGPLRVDQCIQAYERVHALFLPTLLESFSAAYPEAMAMKKPIITSDLGFARSICQDAAEYFDPLSLESATRAILHVRNSSQRYRELINFGSQRLSAFPTARERAEQYLDIIHGVARESAI